MDLKKNNFLKLYDEDNNPLKFEYGLSSFRDIQSCVVQELPEMAPPGLLPMSVNAVIQGSLVNSIKPGDRVQMLGIYKLIGGHQTKERGTFKPYFICLSIKPFHFSTIPKSIRTDFSFREDELFTAFSRSIAPSIYGH